MKSTLLSKFVGTGDRSIGQPRFTDHWTGPDPIVNGTGSDVFSSLPSELGKSEVPQITVLPDS